MSEYKNPIIPGFSPDPSVVLVDGTFFLVNSSFHIFPGLPIYASKDLRNWTHTGNAIHRTEQLTLDKATSDGVPIGPGRTLVATGGLFAPTIRYHNGIFYIICTNCHTEFPNLIMRNFYVTTTNIWSGQWSDPIWFEFRGIDPSLFFDDDGRVYIQGSWREGDLNNTKCSIRQFEVDIATGKPLSETKWLWDGFAEKDDAEGPHIYKKDGYYYLIAAESGTFEHHMITAARSTSIWGPYEACKKNPILTAFGTGEYIQNTGHGDIFQDGNGRWWAVVLGVRNEDGRYPLGRETFLAPASWPEGGWPKIEHPRIQFQHMVITASGEFPASVTSEPESGYIYIRNPHVENYSFSSAKGDISLTPEATTLSSRTGTTTFLGKRQLLLESTATATLHISKKEIKASGTVAGLALYKDALRHTDIYYNFDTSEVCLANTYKLTGNSQVEKRTVEVADVDTIEFCVRAKPAVYEFCYRVGSQVGSEVVVLGSLDSLDMTACDFTGTIFGIFASADEHSGSPVVFQNFTLSE